MTKVGLDAIMAARKARDPRNRRELKLWLEALGESYSGVQTKIPAPPRTHAMEQLTLLIEFAETFCADGALEPLHDLRRALVALDHGGQPILLSPAWRAYSKPPWETLYQAHLAAAMEMHNRRGLPLRRAKWAIVKKVRIPGLKPEQIEDWRQQYLKGNLRTDMGAAHYHIRTNPGPHIVAGQPESVVKDYPHLPIAWPGEVLPMTLEQ
jgi:hypothetical protein